jgi:hypothetical protein
VCASCARLNIRAYDQFLFHPDYIPNASIVQISGGHDFVPFAVPSPLPSLDIVACQVGSDQYSENPIRSWCQPKHPYFPSRLGRRVF